ncbi:hypothetical protein MNBD_GAMMA22-2693 [hydrothermal vent metagenome]|uniref:Uncharacterized protein n=1 Tax=hydrothermal vent metagenome TaxID=652676 RepID=A0A3B0ZVB0_9ZZZZ
MDYNLKNSTPSLAHIQFLGRFNNNTITWNAKIQTLSSIAKANPKSGLRQFFHITPVNDNFLDISIDLTVKVISKPEILKTQHWFT